MSRQIDQAELIKKAVPIFWVNGFRAVSYKNLAEGMGVSQSFLYNQWGKEQLLLDSIDDYLSREIDPFFHSLEHDERGVGAIRDVYHEVAKSNYSEEPCTCMLMNIALELRHDFTSLDSVYGKFLHDMRSAYTKAFQRSFKDGNIQDVNKIPEYVEMLIGLMFGLNLLLHYKSTEELIVHIDAYFDLID
jgi:AcrR family transcriptional regulator